MRAKFQVYGDLAIKAMGVAVFGGPSFLVQNEKGPSYNTGINADSGYTNIGGTAEMQVLNGKIRPVLAADYPKSG